MQKSQSIKGNYTIIISFLAISLLLIIAGCGGGGSGSGGGGSVVTTDNGNYIPPSSGSGTLTLTWDAPTANSDGSKPLTDLNGYIIYYRSSTGSYNNANKIDIGNNLGTSFSSLSPGTWCFVVTAYDTSGNESDYSDPEICRTI